MSKPPPAPGYRFKHALTQEVAYNSLLIERRRQIHERVGSALESVFGEQLDDHLTQLAHHYRHSDNFEKAIEYLSRAGNQSLARSAHGEASTHFIAALNLLPKLTDNHTRLQLELRLQLQLGLAAFSLKGFSSTEAGLAFTRARELCEQLDDPPESFAVFLGLAGCT